MASRTLTVNWYCDLSGDVPVGLKLSGEINDGSITIQLRVIDNDLTVLEYSEKLSDVMEQNNICPELSNAILEDPNIILDHLNQGNIDVSMDRIEEITIKFTIELKKLKGNFKLKCFVKTIPEKVNTLEYKFIEMEKKLEKYRKQNEELIIFNQISGVVSQENLAWINILYGIDGLMDKEPTRDETFNKFRTGFIKFAHEKGVPLSVDDLGRKKFNDLVTRTLIQYIIVEYGIVRKIIVNKYDELKSIGYLANTAELGWKKYEVEFNNCYMNVMYNHCFHKILIFDEDGVIIDRVFFSSVD